LKDRLSADEPGMSDVVAARSAARQQVADDSDDDDDDEHTSDHSDTDVERRRTEHRLGLGRRRRGGASHHVLSCVFYSVGITIANRRRRIDCKLFHIFDLVVTVGPKTYSPNVVKPQGTWRKRSSS